jgi:hypothetical protein
MEINEIFETLASDNSRNFKINFLFQHSDNELLKRVIFLALDPFTQFYIRKIPEYLPNEWPNITENQMSLSDALTSLSKLSNRVVTGNAAIRHLETILGSVSASDAKVIERIIQKDLKCGVQTATANAVWPNFISEYPCMLASGYEQKLVDKIPFPAYVQLKLDGMRFNAIVRSGEVEFRSRNGKELELLGFLEDEFKFMAGDMDVVFDGELTLNKDGVTLNRQTGNGILNKASKGTISKEEASLVHATIWDAIPYEYFMEGYYNRKYEQRFKYVQACVNSLGSKKVSCVPNEEVHNTEQVNDLFAKYYGSGEEGIILKSVEAPWENKRSKYQIKYKGELECDLKIIGIEEGTGKYKGLLGAIICESSDNIVQVRVGSGMTEEQRKNYFTSEIIGKIAAVKYNARIKNKAGEDSLFLPIFLELREDKTEADSSKDIK